jgi:hypothetical protein
MEQKVPPQRHWKPVNPTFLRHERHRLLGGFGGSCDAWLSTAVAAGASSVFAGSNGSVEDDAAANTFF